MEQVFKATVEIGDKKITFEGPKDFVEEQIRQLVSQQTSTDRSKGVVPNEAMDTGELSEKQLVALKKPKGHPEIATVLAFALAQRGAPEFNEEDIKRAYLRAQVRPPKVVGQALRDAKNLYDYIEPGSKRGTYRLSHHGERVVRFDLPRSS